MFIRSVDETETLCNRLAIQNNGEMYAIGHNQELKTAFSLGFVINIELKADSSLNNSLLVKAFIESSFNRPELRETFGVRIHYEHF